MIAITPLSLDFRHAASAMTPLFFFAYYLFSPPALMPRHLMPLFHADYADAAITPLLFAARQLPRDEAGNVREALRERCAISRFSSPPYASLMPFHCHGFIPMRDVRYAGCPLFRCPSPPCCRFRLLPLR